MHRFAPQPNQNPIIYPEDLCRECGRPFHEHPGGTLGDLIDVLQQALDDLFRELQELQKLPLGESRAKQILRARNEIAETCKQIQQFNKKHGQ